MLVGLWCPKGCSSQAMHPQKDVFDLCPVFIKILTCHNSLLYWQHRVIFINICLNPMKAPHAFISSIKPVWSVIALQGAHVELRTPEGHCVIDQSFMRCKILTFASICCRLTHDILMYLPITIKPHMPSSLRFDLLVNDASNGCSSQVMHPGRLWLVYVLTTINCWLFISVSFGGYHVILINIYQSYKHPICFHPFDGVCWSVIALEGAQIKRCTLERHCVI